MDTTTTIEKTESHTFLPDDIITNILSRLPAKNAMRCRLVCRRWRDLTFSRCFLDLHLRNSIPTILVTKSFSHTEFRSRSYFATSCNFLQSGNGIDSFAIDNWWESDETRLTIHRFPFGNFPNATRALFSHAGLIVLLEKKYCPKKTSFGAILYAEAEVCFVIVNPVTREYMRISLPKEHFKSMMIYGVYFNPVLKEYCSLWKMEEPQSKRFQYKILTVGSNPSLKTISNLFNNTAKLRRANPLLIDNYLYWMLECEQGYRYGGWNDVMKFDIRNEQFGVIPCPVPLNIICFHDQTHLLNIDGILSFVLILSGKITIWKLEDHVKNLWIATEYTLSIESWYNPEKIVDVIVVRDGKLAIMSRGMLYVCNLTDGTVKSLQKSKYPDNVSFLSHQMSLASLKNCNSTIFIDKNDVVVRDKQDLEINGSQDSMEGSSSSN